ncbi:MAG: SGNH/GDSL hydrolase family protein, partial [Planctomycetaceae bacterium]
MSFVVLLRLRRRWKTRTWRLRTVHLLLSLWMLLAVLTGFELYFALIYDETDSFNMTNVSKKWFDRHVAGHEQTLEFGDGQGVRYRDDRPFPEEIEPDGHHVLFVGDSFAFGHGVPDVSDRFSNRVRAELERSHPGEFVVSNLANAGTDLHWVEALLMALFQNGHEIDTVVYAMCLNDIETFHPRHRTYYQGFGGPGPSLWLFRETYFFNLMYFRVMQFTRPEVRGYYDFVREYYEGEPWQRMRQTLDEVNRLCENHGAELRIVVFPFLHNLGPDYEFHTAHEQIVAYGREADVPVLDLEPVLSPHVEEGLTVNRFDAHPNERAHALA